MASSPILSRLVRTPGRRELALFGFAYLLYSLGRFVAIGDMDVAVANAGSIVDLEQCLSVDVEQGVQTALQGSWLLWLLNHLYIGAQLVVVPGALVWLYKRSHTHYALLRNTVLATWLVALPIYALFPCAPPRLAGIGLVDTITTQTGLALDSKLTTSFYNPIAAVPSLHAGFAIAVSAALAAAASRRSLKLAAWMWAPTVCLAVVATGNHFVADIVAGALVTLVGYGLGHLVARVMSGEATVALGRRHGRALLLRSAPKVGVGADRVVRLERLMGRWGGVVLVAGRFVGVVRAFGPFLAGASAMPLRRVAGYSLVGAGVWCGAMIAAGYAFAGSLESHADAAGSIAIGVCGGLLLAWALTRGQAPQERAASAYICARAR